MADKIIYKDKVKNIDKYTDKQINKLLNEGYSIEWRKGKRVGVLRHEKKPV